MSLSIVVPSNSFVLNASSSVFVPSQQQQNFAQVLSPLVDLSSIWSANQSGASTSPSATSPNVEQHQQLSYAKSPSDFQPTKWNESPIPNQLGEVTRVVNTWSKHAAFHEVHDKAIQRVCPGFQGLSSVNPLVWAERINFNSIAVLNYLEIGCCHGASLISVVRHYHKSCKNRYDVLEPFENVDDVDLHMNTLRNNLFLAKVPLNTIRLFHDDYLRTLAMLPSEFYNLIYVNGNCLPFRLLEDMVMAWRRLQSKGGVMIINRYGSDVKPGRAKAGVDLFLAAFVQQIATHYAHKSLYFIVKM